MKTIQRWAILSFIAASSQVLIGCGSTPLNTTGSFSGAALQGNWNLVGTNFFSEPSISLAIAVNGDTISASGNELFGCPNNVGGGGSVQMTGQIAKDGTFTMSSTDVITINGNAEVLTVRGAIPVSGGTTWNGTYTFAFTPGTTCFETQSGNFTAALIPPLNGIYMGSLTQNANQGTAVAVEVTLSQGAFTTLPFLTGNDQYYLPLSGALKVTGIPCFTQGSVSTNSISEIRGDQVFTFFTMNDGSTVHLDGNLNGSNVASLQNVILSPSASSQCAGSYIGVLTKQ